MHRTFLKELSSGLSIEVSMTVPAKLWRLEEWVMNEEPIILIRRPVDDGGASVRERPPRPLFPGTNRGAQLVHFDYSNGKIKTRQSCLLIGRPGTSSRNQG